MKNITQRKPGTSHAPHDRFKFLSLQDLVDARAAYHVHLANLENVVATAVGRYLIRQRDPDASKATAAPKKKYGSPSPRTLDNSIVTQWSWPCVLVFVDRWMQPRDYVEKPDQTVPRLLYLPDGRVVPTCVVLTSERATPDSSPVKFPEQLLGGGCPIRGTSQGTERMGTAGCLVTDGRGIFALTSRHVTGAPGSEVLGPENGSWRRIGRADARSVGRVRWNDAYPGLNPARANLTLDAGLIELDQADEWTSQLFGFGAIGSPVDLHEQTLSLDLIGCPVKARGGASGLMRGKIHALFYRYRTLGGEDEVTDFLIGPAAKDSPLPTRPGDSGTVWCVESAELERRLGHHTRAGEPLLRPIALQWGGHRLAGGGGPADFQFALACNFSAACRALGVEVLRDWNTGYQLFWGQVGHYKIGHASCGLLTSAKLKKLFGPNAHLIGIGDTELLPIPEDELGDIRKRPFVPLADVPDEIWRDASQRKASDGSNHFADVDEPGKGEFEGKTLLELCKGGKNITVDYWCKFYKALGAEKYGAVPFRVWQIYDEMVEFVRQRRVTEYFCAAGLLGHYIGDCGQPLHMSRLHHGSQKSEESVHGVYETQMLNRFRKEFFQELNAALAGKKAAPLVKGGQEAAVATFKLMSGTVKLLKPEDVLREYKAHTGASRIPKMWEKLHEPTVKCIAAACLHLAMLWESAWSEGGGGKIKSSQIVAPKPEDLKKLYLNKEFLKSYTLRQLLENKLLG